MHRISNLLEPAFSRRIEYVRPDLPPWEEIVPLWKRIWESGQITNGRFVAALEEKAAELLGVEHVVAVSSATSGLILSLQALGLRGEVILPGFTFMASAHAIRWNGLTPIFADCDPRTMNIDVRDVAERLTPQTAAIMGVYVFGNPPDMDALQNLAKARGLPLVFDAAHALGASWNGNPAGRFGDLEVFSMSPTKMVTAAEGGLIATGDRSLARVLRATRDYGHFGNYDGEFPGLNARMSEFHAALALQGLPFCQGRVRRRNALARHYQKRLSGVPGLSFQSLLPEARSTYKDFAILVDEKRFGLTRDQLAKNLRRHWVETRRYFFPAVHRQKVYAASWPEASRPLPVTDRLAQEVLCLPLYPQLSLETIDRICEIILSRTI